MTSMAKAFPNPALHNHPNSKLPGEKKVAHRLAELVTSPLSSNRPVAKLVMRLADR